MRFHLPHEISGNIMLGAESKFHSFWSALTLFIDKPKPLLFKLDGMLQCLSWTDILIERSMSEIIEQDFRPSKWRIFFFGVPRFLCSRDFFPTNFSEMPVIPEIFSNKGKLLEDNHLIFFSSWHHECSYDAHWKGPRACRPSSKPDGQLPRAVKSSDSERIHGIFSKGPECMSFFLWEHNLSFTFVPLIFLLASLNLTVEW